MADVFRQRQNGKIQRINEIPDVFLLCLVSGTLQQFHVTLDRKAFLRILLDQTGSLFITPLNPDQNVCVIHHGGAFSDAPSGPVRTRCHHRTFQKKDDP